MSASDATMSASDDWNPEIERASKIWFARDWDNLRQWPRLEGRRVVADSAVKVIVASSCFAAAREHPDVYPDLDALVAGFESAPTEQIVARLRAGEDLVWVSCGTSITGPGMEKEEFASLLKGRLYGIASASLFNAGYAGIKVLIGPPSHGRLRTDGSGYSDWINNHPKRVAVFHAGKVYERPP